MVQLSTFFMSVNSLCQVNALNLKSLLVFPPLAAKVQLTISKRLACLSRDVVQAHPAKLLITKPQRVHKFLFVYYELKLTSTAARERVAKSPKPKSQL